MWFIEKKVIRFRNRTDIRYEPARPELAQSDPAMTLFDGLFLKFVKGYELETFT